jgi:hypothetical protein
MSVEYTSQEKYMRSYLYFIISKTLRRTENEYWTQNAFSSTLYNVGSKQISLL